MKKSNNVSTLLNGLLKNNPVLVLLLGICPALAVSNMVSSGLGMGIVVTVVLLFSNMTISLLKNIIPHHVRIPSYILIIAGFVTISQMLLKAYIPALDNALGIYLPLVTVNCIVLGRAEVFARRNSVWRSALDAIGMGLGFTAALVVIASIRELLGYGRWFGMPVTDAYIDPMAILSLAPGGFFVYGCIIALVRRITKNKTCARKTFGCAACPSSAICENSVIKTQENGEG